MTILNFKTMKTIEILREFKKLSEIDKSRLSIHLLESNYLHLDIDKKQEIKELEEQLVELDSSYATILTNFSKYKYLIFLSAQFMELSEYDKSTLVVEMLDRS